MNARRDVIVRGLGAVWMSQGREFVTFEPQDQSGPEADDQFIDGAVNLRWRRDGDPRAVLPGLGVRLPPQVSVRSYVAGQNAILDVGDADLETVADLVDALFHRVVAGRRGAQVTARVDRGA
jgi:hypothetical protein